MKEKEKKELVSIVFKLFLLHFLQNMSITTHINTFFTYLQEGSSMDVIEPTCYTQNRSRKRKLSRSQRNKRYNQPTKKKKNNKKVNMYLIFYTTQMS